MKGRTMRAGLVVLILALAAPAAAQEQVVTPTYVPERACYQSIPCEMGAPCEAPRAVPCEPAPSPCATSSPCAAPRVIHYEMRSPVLFWTGALFAAGGLTFIISSATWGRESVDPGYAAAPCGTDPVLVRVPVAPCKVSGPLLAAGISLAGTGTAFMFYGGQKVAVGLDGRQITVRVRF